jgi:hypothetical protein
MRLLRDQIWQYFGTMIGLVALLIVLDFKTAALIVAALTIIFPIAAKMLDIFTHMDIRIRLMVIAFIVLLDLFLLTKPPISDTTKLTNNLTFEPAATPITISVGSTIKQVGEDLTLLSAEFDNDTITIYWEFVNNTENSLSIPDRFYSNVNVRDNLNNYLEITKVMCYAPVCAGYIVDPGKKVQYAQVFKIHRSEQFKNIIVTTSNLSANNIQWVIPVNSP